MQALLLDTNVVSELTRRRPSPEVQRWLEEQSVECLHLSAITLGELLRGIHRLPEGAKRRRYETWVTGQLIPQFDGRILAFDREAALVWGKMLGDADRAGRPRPAIDAQIAAIAIRHGLAIATRNTRDFDGLGVDVVDPWAG